MRIRRRWYHNTRDNTPPYDTLPHDWKCKIWDHLHYIVECQVAPKPSPFGEKRMLTCPKAMSCWQKPLWEKLASEWWWELSAKLLPHVTRRSMDMRNKFGRNETRDTSWFSSVSLCLINWSFDRSQSQFDKDDKCCSWSCHFWPCVRYISLDMKDLLRTGIWSQIPPFPIV